jgi:hypothetical protein
MATPEERAKTIELVFSNLALTLQDAMLRLEAYRALIDQGAPPNSLSNWPKWRKVSKTLRYRSNVLFCVLGQFKLFET